MIRAVFILMLVLAANVRADIILYGRTALLGSAKLIAGVPYSDSLANLVSWWRMDEASGTRVDAHGTNNLSDNNTVAQSFAVQTSTTTNSAIFSSGSSEWLNYAAFQNSDFSTTNDWCVGGWFRKTTTSGSAEMLVARDDGAGTSQRGWQIYISAYSVNFDMFTNNVANTVSVPGTQTIDPDNYYFVFAYMETNGSVGLWTALTNAAGFTISTNIFAAGFQDWSTNSNLTFGRRGYPSFEGYYTGLLDEWFYYKRKITSNEVWSIFSNKKSYPP